MEYNLWPVKIHYEQGNTELLETMFQSSVINQHENKWYKDTDVFCNKLYEKIIQSVHSTWKEESPKDKEIKLNGNMLYIHPGNGARTHWHPWAWLSGIFYLQTSNGGEIVLHPPHQSVSIIQSWHQPFVIHPQPGDLLIFPSYILHEVLTHHGPNVRLCMPFDLYVETNGYESYIDTYNRIT